MLSFKLSVLSGECTSSILVDFDNGSEKKRSDVALYRVTFVKDHVTQINGCITTF